MSRRRYLIAYDICEDRRLRKVIKIMESYGERLQYSVFLCDLSAMEVVQWRSDIVPAINVNEDSVVCIDLGALGATAAMTILGRSRRLPTSGPTIV